MMTPDELLNDVRALAVRLDETGKQLPAELVAPLQLVRDAMIPLAGNPEGYEVAPVAQVDREMWLTVEQWLDVHFVSCGLNADWAVSAWKVSRGQTNVDPGLYLLDNEDGNLFLVFRDFREGAEMLEDGGVRHLATFPIASIHAAIMAAVNHPEGAKPDALGAMVAQYRKDCRS